MARFQQLEPSPSSTAVEQSEAVAGTGCGGGLRLHEESECACECDSDGVDQEEDDFMDFINDALSLPGSDRGSSPASGRCYSTADIHSVNDARLLAAEKKSSEVVRSIRDEDHMSCLEDLLSENNTVSSTLLGTDEDSPVTAASRMCVPEKDKTELDLLMEQASDEVRLLERRPFATSSIGQSGHVNVNANDEVEELIRAAQDAALLEKKYGVHVPTGLTNKDSRIGMVSGATRIRGDCDDNVNSDDESDESRSYGSNISDDSVISDSD